MLQGEEEVQKLVDFVRKKFPQLNSEEVDKISHQLMNLGFFLVRLRIKKYTEASASKDEENFSQPIDRPP